IALGFVGLMLGLKRPMDIQEVSQFGLLVAVATSIMFAGAGIATQPSFQATKGLHGSTLFTLSLPVSRFRLLAVRAGLGWLEMAGFIGAMCCGLWILSPALRSAITPEEMFRQAVALVVCVTGLYCIPVLLATFLDDQWRLSGSMIVFGALWWLFNYTPLPASANIFRAMGDSSPLIAHTMPWLAMSISLGLAAVLFFAALKVVQSREY
ncbi:MAG: hypothetical protein GY953_08330, partial [bacterium]|nr:hypothetical protein [bacterium]